MARYELTVNVDIPEDIQNIQEIEERIKQARDEAGLNVLEHVLRAKEADLFTEEGLQKKDQPDKTYQTLLGTLTMKRWRSQDSRYPVDEILGVQDKKGVSSALRQAIENQCAQRPYGQACAVVNEMYGVNLSVMTCWRVLQDAGAQLKKPTRQQDMSLPVLAAGQDDPCPILGIDPDATYVRSRGKDKKSHEVKLAVLYRGREPVSKSKDRIRWGLSEKQGVIAGVDQEADVLFQKVTAKALAYGLHQNSRVICHGDGDPWIKRLKRDYIPQTLNRLDPYHVFKKIREATQVEDIPTAWLESFYTAPATLIEHIETFKQQLAETGDQERVDELLVYLRNNQAGMEPSGVDKEIKKQHPRMYRRGSGTIESNVDVFVGLRCKRSRMSWSKAGLDHILLVRERYLNKQSDFTPRPIGNNKRKTDETPLIRDFVRNDLGRETTSTYVLRPKH